MTSQSGQIDQLASFTRKPRPFDYGWAAFSAKLAPAMVTWPEKSRDGSTVTVRIQRPHGHEETYSADSVGALIELVKSDWGLS